MSNMLTPAWKPLKYHSTQYEAWTCSKRIVALPCGRASGKTELARRRLIRYLPVEVPGELAPKYFYSCPTYPQAKRVGWQPLLDLIPAEWIVKTDASALVIKTIFGSELHIVGLDRPMRIEGVQWCGGVMDESCDTRAGAFDLSILPALTWNRGWCWRIGVPKRFGPGAQEFKDFYDKARAGLIDDAAGFTWPSSEIVPPELLKYAQENMDPRDYAEQFEASWVNSSGGIFHSFSEEQNVRPCKYDPSRAIIVSSDFNIDPFTSILAHRYGELGAPDCYLEVFDEIFLRDCNTPHALDVIFNRYRQHKAGFDFFGDASGKARKTSASKSDYAHILGHEGFRSAGRNVWYSDSNPPVADRFAACNALICNGTGKRRMYVDQSCKHLLVDLKTRSYKPGERKANDKGDVGHITDALGYAIYRLFPLRIPLGDFTLPEVSIF